MRSRERLWHVYLLECADKSIYCGISNNLARRLREHNGELGGGARYTRARRPVVLRACLPCRDRRAATRMEALIKSLPANKKMAFFEGSR